MPTTLYYAGPQLGNAGSGDSATGSTQGAMAGGQVMQMPANSVTTAGLGYAAVGATPVQLPPVGFTTAVGNDTVSGGLQYGSLRFLPVGGFANASLCADLVLPGGNEASSSWYINLYTIAGGFIPAFPPTSTLFFAGPCVGTPGSGTDCYHSSTNGTLASGSQPIYIDSNFFPNQTAGNGGTNAWLRFCTNAGVVNGQNVVDLIMFGGAYQKSSWVLQVYAFSGGFLT